MVWVAHKQEWLCLLLWSSFASSCGVSERHDTCMGRGHRSQEQKQTGQPHRQPQNLFPNPELMELRKTTWASIEEWQVEVHVQQVISNNGGGRDGIDERGLPVHEQEQNLLHQRDIRHIRGGNSVVEVQGRDPLR